MCYLKTSIQSSRNGKGRATKHRKALVCQMSCTTSIWLGLQNIFIDLRKLQNYKHMQDSQPSDNRIEVQPNPQGNADVNLNQNGASRRRARNPSVDSMFRVGITQENIAYIQQHKILFLSGKIAVVDPKEESYFIMLKNTFCPSVLLQSLTTLLMVLNTGVFIAELIVGFDSKQTVLEVNLDTLLLMGLNDSRRVYGGQVYRLVAAQFLHANMLHLICNIFILLLLVSRLEYTFGKAKIFIVYMLSGIAGDIFSNILSTDLMLKVGSSTSLYGMIGLSIGYIIINWPAFSRIGFIFKFKIIFIVVLLSAFLLLFSDVAVNVDYLGHLGAFVSGIFLTSIVSSIQQRPRETCMRVVFGILFVGQVAACFLIFYLLPSSSYSTPAN